MYNLKSVPSALRLFLAVLSLSVTAACCPPCLQPVLPTEPPPALIGVETDESGGLDETNTREMLGNLYIYQGALDRCNSTILLYNATIKK